MGFADLLVTGISLSWVATAASAGQVRSQCGLCVDLFYVPPALSVIELSARYPRQGGV